jgi:hypothetical protein
MLIAQRTLLDGLLLVQPRSQLVGFGDWAFYCGASCLQNHSRPTHRPCYIKKMAFRSALPLLHSTALDL